MLGAITALKPAAPQRSLNNRPNYNVNGTMPDFTFVVSETRLPTVLWSFRDLEQGDYNVKGIRCCGTHNGQPSDNAPATNTISIPDLGW
jgi:hypothetical protein